MKTENKFKITIDNLRLGETARKQFLFSPQTEFVQLVYCNNVVELSDGHGGIRFAVIKFSIHAESVRFYFLDFQGAVVEFEDGNLLYYSGFKEDISKYDIDYLDFLGSKV